MKLISEHNDYFGDYNEILNEFSNSPFLTADVIKLADDAVKFAEDAVINFLRKNGYRPKPTTDYFKRLNARLKRKGLALSIEVEPSEPLQPTWRPIISNSVKISMKIRFIRLDERNAE